MASHTVFGSMFYPLQAACIPVSNSLPCFLSFTHVTCFQRFALDSLEAVDAKADLKAIIEAVQAANGDIDLLLKELFDYEEQKLNAIAASVQGRAPLPPPPAPPAPGTECMQGTGPLGGDATWQPLVPLTPAAQACACSAQGSNRGTIPPVVQVMVYVQPGQPNSFSGFFLQSSDLPSQLEAYTAFSGRMPVPPEWVLSQGAIMGTEGGTQVVNDTFNVVNGNAPISALWMQVRRQASSSHKGSGSVLGMWREGRRADALCVGHAA